METAPDWINSIITDEHFVGLWTYKPYKKIRKFSVSVVVNGKINETSMQVSWTNALRAAKKLIDENVE